jgi:hypothetical protein
MNRKRIFKKKLTTMWNFFKRRRQKELLSGIRNLSTMFGILDQLSKRGNIYWKEKDNILLIEERFALLKIAEGKEGFQKFLEQVATWQNYQLITAAYEQRVLDIETEAVRHAQQDNPNLTNADIYRIRQHARTTMSEIKPESLDVIREFDIMVIRTTAPSAKDATQENGQLLAIGHYDGTQVEMAMYEDVKHALHNEE